MATKRQLLVFAAFLAGCATAPPPAPPTSAPVPPPGAEAVPVPPPPSPPPAPAQPPRESVAVAGLMDSARNDAAAGRLTNAAASLERALRIRPRNPRRCHGPARVPAL